MQNRVLHCIANPFQDHLSRNNSTCIQPKQNALGFSPCFTVCGDYGGAINTEGGKTTVVRNRHQSSRSFSQQNSLICIYILGGVGRSSAPIAPQEGTSLCRHKPHKGTQFSGRAPISLPWLRPLIKAVNRHSTSLMATQLVLQVAPLHAIG